MASGYRNSAGQDTDDLFDPDTVGDGPQGTGYRRSDGSVLRYAAAKYGQPGAAVGYRMSNGVDIGTLWARKGTAVYTFPFNGQRYTGTSGRGTASVSMSFSSNGTWSISATTGSPTSGTWLSYGGTAADYSVQFVMTGFASGADPDGGSNGYSNGAASPVSLSSGATCGCTSSATVTNSSAGNYGTVTVKLFKSGALVNTSTCTFSTEAAG